MWPAYVPLLLMMIAGLSAWFARRLANDKPPNGLWLPFALVSMAAAVALAVNGLFVLIVAALRGAAK